MRVKKGFILRELAGEKIISGEGLEQIDFNKIVTLNSSAAYIWENIYDKEFDLSFVTELLTSRYNVENSIAQEDASKLISSWTEIGLIGTIKYFV